jgi:hypothetical protein
LSSSVVPTRDSFCLPMPASATDVCSRCRRGERGEWLAHGSTLRGPEVHFLDDGQDVHCTAGAVARPEARSDGSRA